jgi:allantoinase
VPTELVIRGQRVVTPTGVRPASIHVEAGRIVAVAAFDAVPAGAQLVDADDAVVMPGVVDTHVHVNEPGRTEWEGFNTATQAAAAGGVTALVDMPLNSIPATTTLAALKAKQAAAAGQLWIDVGFWGGVVPGNAGELAAMSEAGAIGFKCFLCESGVDEFACVGEAELHPAMRELARIHATLLVHAEVPGPLEAAAAEQARTRPDPRSYATYLASRPRAAENEAIDLVVRLCRDTNARTHIVHHASSDALPTIAHARATGLPLSAETCPHYLTFAAENIADGATAFQVPRRSASATTASACGRPSATAPSSSSPRTTRPARPPSSTRSSATSRPRGAASPACSSRCRSCGPRPAPAASPHRHRPLDVRRPGRARRHLAPQGPPRARRRRRHRDLPRRRDAPPIVPQTVLHRHKVTPYAGRTLDGVVDSTYLRGQRVWHRGALETYRPLGRTIPAREPR